jgi:hypothetical protein
MAHSVIALVEQIQPPIFMGERGVGEPSDAAIQRIQSRRPGKR